MDEDPLDLDWGPITVEYFDSNRRLALHLVNHAFTTRDAVRLTICFLNAKVSWYRRHLPAGIQQIVFFDDRGQGTEPEVREQIRRSLLLPPASISFASEGTAPWPST